MPYLDYSLKTCEERISFVKTYLEKLPLDKRNNAKVLEKLSDYIINGLSKQERKGKKILTDNRMATINKRETSFEGIIDKLEFEDSIYSIINENKQTILTPKVCITKKDVEEIPNLKNIQECIIQLEEIEKKARGLKKYILKKWLIELRKDQYVIKDSYKHTQYFNKISHNALNPVDNYNEEVHLTDEKRVESD